VTLETSWWPADTSEPVRWAAGLGLLFGLRVYWALRKRHAVR